MHNKQYNIKNEEQKKTSKNVEQKKKGIHQRNTLWRIQFKNELEILS